MVSEVYTLRLTLERLPNQKPMDELINIPRPSQLDDCKCYYSPPVVTDPRFDRILVESITIQDTVPYSFLAINSKLSLQAELALLL